MQRRTLQFISLLLLLALLAGCQTAAPAAPTAAPTAPPAAPTAVPAAPPVLTLTGIDGTTKTLTLDEIKALPAVEGWGGIMSSTGRITVPERYKGVALMELWKLAGGVNPDGGITVTAKDGYAMTISHGQIDQDDFVVYDPGTGDEIKTAAPLEVAVVYERAGQPLDPESDGVLRLMVLSEKNDRVVDGHWSVKWVTEIQVKELAQEWTVSLEGALVEQMDRATFESGSSPDCHEATWKDEKAQVWTGIPLWLLIGRVDDENKHGDAAYNEALAAAGYEIEVIAADGYSVKLDSKRVNRNDNIIVAYLVNGNPLEEKHFPLRLVGSDLQKNEMAGQIARIVLHLAPPEPTPVPTAAQPAGEAALVISGLVNKDVSFTMDELHGMDVVTLTAEHPKKGTQENTGVRLNGLLALAGVKAEATKLELVAGDGFTAEVALADVLACADCLIAFNESGQLKSVMPGMESGLWVKDVVKIVVK